MQRQRVALMRPFLFEPDVLLMDEPFGALDPVIRAQAQADLARVQKRLGTTVILVTHDMADAEAAATPAAPGSCATRSDSRSAPAADLSAPSPNWP